MGNAEMPGVQVFGNPAPAIEAFASRVSRVSSVDLDSDEVLRRYLPDLLQSEEALVPRFNSPPSEWAPLKGVLEQASAIGVGVTLGEGSVPTLVGAYIGGLFLVKFVTPIVTEVGNATADGVGARIRRAFGLDFPVPSQSEGNADEAAPARGGALSSREGGDEGGSP
ncbi:hypothetical protein [Streptomyces tibetensis]|uniref:hypothetical protein n=1 Tax=Streptomyces tibetensis TaxID=2382123 RepID=UPI0033D940D0